MEGGDDSWLGAGLGCRPWRVRSRGPTGAADRRKGHIQGRFPRPPLSPALPPSAPGQEDEAGAPALSTPLEPLNPACIFCANSYSPANGAANASGWPRGTLAGGTQMLSEPQARLLPNVTF